MKQDRRNLLLFFVLTFIWTWAFYALIVITGISAYEMPGMIFLIMGGGGPSIVGVALTFFTYTKEQQTNYWQRVISFKRIGLRWWGVILLMFPIINALSIGLDTMLGGAVPALDPLHNLIANPLVLPQLVLLWLMSGPVAEELGWRGFALDPLLKRYGVLTGSLILGLIWGVWHLPLFFMPATWHGQMGFQFAGFWSFMALSVGNALIFTWVYVNTNRSILTGILLHFASNFTANMVGTVSSNVEIARSFLVLAVGIAVYFWMERPGKEQVREVKQVHPA